MNIYKLIAALIVLNFCSVYSQDKYDFQWIFGPNPIGSLMDFRTDPPTSTMVSKKTWMNSANTSMCDKDGNLLFYSNGCHIAGADHNIIPNGDSINSGIIYDHGYCNFGGAPTPFGVLSIPAPWDERKFLMFNLNLDTLFLNGSYPPTPRMLFCHVIDCSDLNNGCYVDQKKMEVLSDTLKWGGIQATKHANQRDWWVIVGKTFSNCYYIVLVDSLGINEPKLSCDGPPIPLNGGLFPIFTPDGSRFLSLMNNEGIVIFNFDNVNGELHYEETITINDIFVVSSYGLSVSPNSRFAYFSGADFLYQIDLNSNDKSLSINIVSEIEKNGNPSFSNFGHSRLGPDGRIYIIGSGNSKYLHVINYPDCPGENCQVVQNLIELNTLSFRSIPNLPHFRNQPSGVNCDSIATSTQNIVKQGNVAYSIHPVPAYDFVRIENTGENKTEVIANIFDLMGNLVLVSQPFHVSMELQVGYLPAGLYIYTVRSLSDKSILSNGKMMIVK